MLDLHELTPLCHEAAEQHAAEHVGDTTQSRGTRTRAGPSDRQSAARCGPAGAPLRPSGCRSSGGREV